ncbi:MAG: hypothetical protein M3Z26_03085 [Bacteroidota bacterium]|nr:hypothetical protein [Bacteroidota bacterium]
MKYFFLITLMFGTSVIYAQKYVLLDKHIAQPITYTNTITPTDKLNDLFPVEKKSLGHFVKALKEIAEKLAKNGHLGEAKQYEIGCTKFTGLTVPLARGDRLDYVITSICNNVKISMHLSDAKITNASNAYFINTWIKYIESSMK